jgi:hypothetical protein
MNFFATYAELISINRSDVTSLSSDFGVHNIEIYVDLNYELKNAGIKAPYIADVNNAQNTQGTLFDGLAAQTTELNLFLYNVKYLWATHKEGGLNQILLCNQVRNGLFKLFDKSDLNNLLGDNLSSTTYLDIYKIINVINSGNTFYEKMMSFVQLRQVLDGVADSGTKTEAQFDNNGVFLYRNYKFNEGDSINSILLVNDGDLPNGQVSVDKWVITFIQKKSSNNITIIPFNTNYKYINYLDLLIKSDNSNTFTGTIDGGYTWANLIGVTNTGLQFIEGRLNGTDMVVYSNNTNTIYISTDGINYTTLTAAIPVNIVYFSKLFNKYFAISGYSYYYSSNLINWTMITAFSVNNNIDLYSFSENNNTVVVGTAVPLYTIDGINWSNCIFTVQPVNQILLTAIINSIGSEFIATGVDLITGLSTNYMSNDGITWTEKIFVAGSYLVMQTYLPLNNTYIGISLASNTVWSNSLCNQVITYIDDRALPPSYNILINSISNNSNSAYNIVLINLSDLNSIVPIQTSNLIN